MKRVRPPANPASYCEREYGVSRSELKLALERLHRAGEKNRQEGKSRVFTGDIEALLKEDRRQRA